MKRKIKLYFIELCSRFLSTLTFSKFRRLQIGSLSLRIPINHTLPYFKSRHPLYDEFIGYLAGTIDNEKCIIDVGSNVGDTAAFIANKSNCNLVLVEPSEKYFSYLEKNVSDWKLSQQVLLYNVALSDVEKGAGKLYHHGGTAAKSTTRGANIRFQKGDDLRIVDKIGLIKVDTDGYDSDVLFSFKSRIKQDEPIIFFENQIISNDINVSYGNLYSLLNDNGYSVIVVFDNFGNLLMRLTNFSQLLDLNSYLLRMIDRKLESTFFYLDVVVGTKNHLPQINSAVESFMEANFSDSVWPKQ